MQICRLAWSFVARTKWPSIAIWVTTWEFWTVTKAQTRPSKCADSPNPSLFAWMTPNNSKWVSQSQTADKPMALRGNSHTTFTRHQEDKLNKAASSLSFPSRWSQNKNGHKVTKYRPITESCNGSTNQQRISNNRIIALEQTVLSLSGVLKLHFTGTNLRPRFCCCWSTKF